MPHYSSQDLGLKLCTVDTEDVTYLLGVDKT